MNINELRCIAEDEINLISPTTIDNNYIFGNPKEKRESLYYSILTYRDEICTRYINVSHVFTNDDSSYFYIVLREKLYDPDPGSIDNKYELNVSKDKFNYSGLDLLMKYLSINVNEFPKSKSNLDLNWIIMYWCEMSERLNLQIKI